MSQVISFTQYLARSAVVYDVFVIFDVWLVEVNKTANKTNENETISYESKKATEHKCDFKQLLKTIRNG